MTKKNKFKIIKNVDNSNNVTSTFIIPDFNKNLYISNDILDSLKSIAIIQQKQLKNSIDEFFIQVKKNNIS